MTFGYRELKTLAREIGCSTDDLLVLTPGNDPFYAGVGARAEAGKWFAVLWTKFGFGRGLHLRRIHYVCVSQDPPLLMPDGQPYSNTMGDWKYLGIASLAARYLKLIPPKSLVDRRNPVPILNAPDGGNSGGRFIIDCDYSLPKFSYGDLELPSFWLGGFDPWQPHLVELWVEKSTMNDVLVPLSLQLGFNLVTGVGEMSEVATQNVVTRAIETGKPMHIIYISDFDPAGRSMPVAVARKIEYTLHDIGAGDDIRITLNPLALTPEQCAKYRLPRTPIKEGEKRAPKFEQRFGSGATELDALEALYPGELARLVREEVGRYIDPSLAERVRKAKLERERDLEALRERVTERYADELQQIQDRHKTIVAAVETITSVVNADAKQLLDRIERDLRAEMPDLPADRNIPVARAANPVENPLFDSRRDFMSQLDAYRRWQGR